ncbi:LacI family DNA-binding transcriptional regulator [soil metagenome]
MRVRLKEVAQEAGVSMMTVSNVINGNHARVSPETAERVRQIAYRLGYVPSAPARSLAARSSRLIGFLVPAASGESLAISPHTMVTGAVIEREFRKHDYHVILRGISQLDEVSEALQTWNLDGAILLGFVDEDIDQLRSPVVENVPIVAIDSYSTNSLTTGVRSDDFEGARLATEHLLDLGHTCVAFASPRFTEVGLVRNRFEGYRRAFTDAGVDWNDRLVVEVDTTQPAGRELGHRLHRDHPHVTAVFATADILAIGIVAGLLEAHVSVPDDVSVTGFDNLDIAEYVTPKLTTVSQDIDGKAAAAVRMLLAEIETHEPPPEPVSLAVELIKRDTTASVRRNDRQ